MDTDRIRRIVYEYLPRISKIVGKQLTVLAEERGNDCNVTLGLPGNYENLALFTLSYFPGCCGILVSNHTFIDLMYRRKGIGRILMEIKEKIASVEGYSRLIATDVKHNPAQIHLFETCGWKQVHSFVNSRTSNTVLVWVKEIATSNDDEDEDEDEDESWDNDDGYDEEGDK